MDWRKLRNGIEKVFSKYKYIALVIVAGLILMLMPNTAGNEHSAQKATTAEEKTSLETQLKQTLQCVKGVGRVEVLLTEASGENVHYQTDTDQSGDRIQNDTVIITDEDRAESGLVIRRDPPEYLGAIIVCDGADDMNVRLQVVEAVSKATGLGADKISVLKMK